MIWVSRPPRPPCRHGLLAAAPCMAPEHPTDPNRFLTSFPSRPRGLDPSHFPARFNFRFPTPRPLYPFFHLVLCSHSLLQAFSTIRDVRTPALGYVGTSRTPLETLPSQSSGLIFWPTRHIESCAGRLLSIGGGGSWSFSVPKKYPRFRYVCPTMVLSLWPVGIRGTQQIWEMRVLCAWKSVVSVL